MATAVKPDLVIFVMDGSIGQAAFDQAKAFRDSVEVCLQSSIVAFCENQNVEWCRTCKSLFGCEAGMLSLAMMTLQLPSSLRGPRPLLMPPEHPPPAQMYQSHNDTSTRPASVMETGYSICHGAWRQSSKCLVMTAHPSCVSPDVDLVMLHQSTPFKATHHAVWDQHCLVE